LVIKVVLCWGVVFHDLKSGRMAGSAEEGMGFKLPEVQFRVGATLDRERAPLPEDGLSLKRLNVEPELRASISCERVS